WGVDFAAAEGAVVKAPLAGTVSFAGLVAGMRTVTIEQGGMKVSVSYLADVEVATGQRVGRGVVIGTSGRAHGEAAVHLSVRLGGEYVDPAPFLRCSFNPISDALRLVPYPGSRANRNSRRYVRPAAPRPSPHRRGGLPATPARPGGVHAGRRPMAEGGATRVGSRTPLGDDPSGGCRRRLLRCRRT